MEFGEIIVILDVKDKTNDNKQPVSDHTLSSNVILVRSSPLSTEFRENRFKHGNASITSTQCVYVCVCVCVCVGGGCCECEHVSCSWADMCHALVTINC